MKKLFTLTIFLLGASFVFGQSKVACCGQSATEKFAMLASSAKFRNAHLKPLPVHFQSTIGKAVSYPTPDGKRPPLTI